MNSLRKTVGFVIVLMLAVFALPGNAAAPTKNYSANILPAQVASGATVNLIASFANTSPPSSNSAINSVIITLPANSGLTINSITFPTAGNFTLVPSSAVLPYSGSGALQIKVYNIPGGGVHVGDLAYQVKINVTAPVTSSCQPPITWGTQAFTGNAWSGDTFAIQPPSSLMTSVGCVFSGNAACGDPIQTGDPLSNGSRGLYDKSGNALCSTAVAWTFTNNLYIDGSTTMKFVNGPTAFSYTVFATPVDVDSTGWYDISVRPLMGWDFDGNGNPIYKLKAVACVSGSLPTPYGAFVSDNGAGKITIDTTFGGLPPPNGVAALPAVPFPIVIDTERMQVTSVTGSGSILTVTHATGGTTQAPHLPGAFVMSTPLPIDPNPKLADGTTGNPYLGKVDHMCVAERGWASFDIDPNTGVQRVRRFSTIFDIGDGWVSFD